MSYTMTCGFVVADKMPPGEVVDRDVYGQTPRFGRWWWFWVPTGHTNGGRFSRDEVVDVTFCWLCFAVSVTFWPKGDPR